MTTDTKKTEAAKEPKQPSPPVLIHGPAGSGKTLLIDLLVKFYESDRVEDGYTLPKDREDGPREGRCRFSHLKPGTLYLTNEPQTEEDMMHAGLGHGVLVLSIYEAMETMGKAKGKTMTEYTLERFVTAMLKGALGMDGPRRGGGAPRSPFG